MNTDFRIIDNKAIVFTDKEAPVKRNATNNIEEILVCENNIEEMENNLYESKKLITLLQNKLWFNWGTIASAILWVGCGIFTICVNNHPWIACIPFLCGAGLTAMSIDDIKTHLNLIKANKCVVTELENNLQTEKEKLNELNKDKTNDLVKNMEYLKPISKSEEMYNLKRKLNVIQYYQINKKKLIKAYNEGNLRTFTALSWFCDDDNILLEELIKNDLNKNEEKCIAKQKTLKK